MMWRDMTLRQRIERQIVGLGTQVAIQKTYVYDDAEKALRLDAHIDAYELLIFMLKDMLNYDEKESKGEYSDLHKGLKSYSDMLGDMERELTNIILRSDVYNTLSDNERAIFDIFHTYQGRTVRRLSELLDTMGGEHQ